MKVLEFIRSNPNWEEELAQAPYYVKTTWKGNYAILKYNQLNSDFNNEIVRECRGCIFYIPNKDHGWADLVCYPFEKFGNYGEGYVPEIDWSSAKVLEKVDGSLIKIWYHRTWHVSTNGTIDANDAETSMEGVTFYDVFKHALEKNGNLQDFFKALNPSYTYMFELVSPTTRVTVDYPEDALYFLCARSMSTFEETFTPPRLAALASFVKLPKIYNLTSLEDCIAVAEQMSKDEEGFVVSDKYFNRVKIKSPEYLIAARMRHNGAITVRYVVTLMKNNSLDDFMAYVPAAHGFVNKVLDAYKRLLEHFEETYKAVKEDMEVNHIPCYQSIARIGLPKQDANYCFARANGKVASADEYCMSFLFTCSLVEFIKDILD
jgi:hypothetical protein